MDIPRSRFLPVKKTTDLMLVMSNIYTLEEGTLTMTPDRANRRPPLVELGDEHFKEVGRLRGPVREVALNLYSSCFQNDV